MTNTNNNKHLEIYDTTLRDGSQGEGVSFSLEGKIATALELDNLGVTFIEGGWPSSNPKDEAFFKEIQKQNLKHAQVATFGMTRKAGIKADQDQFLTKLVDAGCPVVTIVGKTWDFHVTHALKVSFEENIAMIADSVAFLKKQGLTVIFDAEHFFDGYKRNQAYTLEAIKAAQDSGADNITLCDTNGGCLPDEMATIVKSVRQEISVTLGIHTHNDGNLGVANALAAIQAGATHVQGTINGFGERCGNADLCALIPNLQLKMGYHCLPEGKIEKLTEISRLVYDTTNKAHINNQPFVGTSAFAHKGGLHVSAVNKDSTTYEHLPPESVGNSRRILISELSGRSNILAKSQKYDLAKHPEALKTILSKVQDLEKLGYSFEAADASFELLIREAMEEKTSFFTCESYRVIIENRKGDEVCEATVKITVNGKEQHSVAEGHGPVDALKCALRRALEDYYPTLSDMVLTDYKMRILEGDIGTASTVRVIITSQDKKKSWSTVGVSHNSLDASWHALVDSINYKLTTEDK